MKLTNYRIQLYGIGVVEVHTTTWNQAQAMIRESYFGVRYSWLGESPSNEKEQSIKLIEQYQ